MFRIIVLALLLASCGLPDHRQAFVERQHLPTGQHEYRNYYGNHVDLNRHNIQDQWRIGHQMDNRFAPERFEKLGRNRHKKLVADFFTPCGMYHYRIYRY